MVWCDVMSVEMITLRIVWVVWAVCRMIIVDVDVPREQIFGCDVWM